MFQEKKIEQLKNEYFQKLYEKILIIFRNQDFGIINFFYKIVFDQNYYQLTRIAKFPEIDLNYGIAKMLLYPIDGIQLNNTNQVISLIPMFVMFVIGQKLNIDCCIKLEMENEWDLFLTAVAKKINNEEAQANEYLRLFHIKLEMQSKQSLAFDLEKTMNLISSYTKGEKLLRLLNLMFYQDCSIFAVYSSKSQDDFINFQTQKKLEIIINTYEFIQRKHKKEIENTLEDSKMKVAISFLQKNYNYDYLTEKFDNLQAGILIFSLIQLDCKQFQNFFFLKSSSVQEQLLDQIMQIAGNTDKFFFNLILVGKCLSKLRYWEYALDIYSKLYKQITNHLNKEKFRVYIYYKICKIQFLQGQIQGLLKKLNHLSDLMLQYQEKNLEFYQPNNRNIYNSCLFLQLLISAYTKQIDKLKHITIRISTLHLISNHNNSQKRPFNLLQYEFFRLVQQQGVIFQEKDGKNQLEHILQVIQRCCQQRQDIQSKKQTLLANIKQIFDSTNKKANQLIEIKSYYRAIEEILIINVLVRHREIYILQYLNPNFYPQLRIFLEEKDFFNKQLKSQIYFFIHDFDKAYDIAVKTNNHKMIGQILEYRGRYSEAIEHYKQDISPSCLFNCAMLYKIQQDKERSSLDKSGFEKLQFQSPQQLAITSFRNLAQSQNQYKMIAQMFQQVLLRRQNQQLLTEKIDGEIEYVNTVQINYRLTQSTKSLEQKFKEDSQNDQINQVTECHTIYRSYDSRISGQKMMVQSQMAENIESDSSSIHDQLSNEDNMLLKMQFYFNFPVRKDIEFFYLNLKHDIISEQDLYLERTLDEFVKKTQFLKYESSELFINNNLKEKIGQGGNSEVYKFYFQGQEYAAKVIQFEYKGSGETINDDEKLEIQNKLLEICIVCDITMSKIKYCLRIEHLGFKFEKLQGQIKVYKIILITNFYNSYQQLSEWEEIDKIKYVYKLSLGLAILQFDKELLHLDLKPDNVLVDSVKKNPVLADFGLSKYSQQSYFLSNGLKQMTIKYIDPDLVYNNFQSRKNDVYSFGVSLFQYFSGSIPFKELNYQQIHGQIKKFQEYHQTAIKQINNDLIRNLILDCTKSKDNRISFVQVLQRLFFYLYQINNSNVKQLIEILFQQIEIQQNERKIKYIYTYLKVMKKFIKQINSFKPIKFINKILQRYIIISSKDSGNCFPEIIQRMKQFINWVILNEHDFVLKLIDFDIKTNQINQNETEITFSFWVEDAQIIQQDRLILWQPFFKEIATNLQSIHNYQICQLYLPLSQIYEKNGKIKLNFMEYSQNLSIDQNYYYNLDSIPIDPKINLSKKFSLLNDDYAFCILIEQTIRQIKSKLDQNEQKKISTFELEIKNEKETISLKQIIDKLQN